MTELNIAGGFYESDSLPISAQQCTNLYVNVPQTEGAWSTANLFGTPGLEQIITSGTVSNANRGSHVKNGVPYFLNGETLYRLDRTIDSLLVETFTLVNLGTIPGTDRASFSDNGTQLIIIVNGSGWIMNEAVSATITLITDAGFTANGVPKQVVFVDSFFLVTTDSKKFIRSDSNNGLSWSALNFFTAEADPDDIVAPIVFKGQAFIGGSETIEVFQDIAGSFQRISGAVINKGIYAPFGIVNTSDSFMFVGGGVNESPAIWSVQGSNAQKVSTTAIDAALRKCTKEDIEACHAWSYAQAGAYFVGFTFPKFTFVLDTITAKWHQRKSEITDARGLALTTKWRMNSLVTAYGRVICGDAIDGRIGNLNLDVFEEYGSEIIRTLATQPFTNQGSSFSVSNLELMMESGVGLSGGVDPQIRLSISKDGKTYNNELSRGFGKIGEYTRRIIWRMLGRFPRLAVFKFETSANVKIVIVKLIGKVSSGNA